MGRSWSGVRQALLVQVSIANYTLGWQPPPGAVTGRVAEFGGAPVITVRRDGSAV